LAFPRQAFGFRVTECGSQHYQNIVWRKNLLERAAGAGQAWRNSANCVSAQHAHERTPASSSAMPLRSHGSSISRFSV